MPIITWLPTQEWEVLFPMTNKRKWFDGSLSAEEVFKIAVAEWKKIREEE